MIKRLMFAVLLLTGYGWSQCTPGTWTVANQPPSNCIPYSQNGIFTKQLPNAGAGGPTNHLFPNSDPIVANVFSNTSPGIGYSTVAAPGNTVGDGLGEPIYYGRASDPTYCFPTGLPRTGGTLNNPSGKCYHIPNQARFGNATAGGDQFFVVWDQTQNAVFGAYHCCGAPAPLPNCASGSTCAGPGSWFGYNVANWSTDKGYINPDVGQGGCCGALNVPGWALLIRNKEWMEGQINHAIYINTACEASTSVVFPDTGSSAATCSSLGGSNTNRPQNGNLLFLSMTDAEINALNLPAWQKPVVMAMAHYGGYIGDTNGSVTNGNFNPSRFESPVPYVMAGVTDPIPAWLCPSSCQAGVSKATTPQGSIQFNMQFFAGLPLNRFHIADPCVALGLAGLPGGCVSSPVGVAQVAPSTPTIPSVNIGKCTTAQTSTLSNTGSASYTYNSNNISGTNSADYQPGGTGTCVNGQTITTGGTCTLSYKFCPVSSPGVRAAQMNVLNTASNGTQVISFSATATMPQAVLSPPTLDFGARQVNTGMSPTQDITLTNPGTGPLTVTAVTVPPPFSIQSTTCSSVVAAGANCKYSIGFNPTIVGSFNVNFQTTDDSTPPNQLVPVTGVGTSTPTSGGKFACQLGCTVMDGVVK